MPEPIDLGKIIAYFKQQNPQVLPQNYGMSPEQQMMAQSKQVQPQAPHYNPLAAILGDIGQSAGGVVGGFGNMAKQTYQNYNPVSMAINAAYDPKRIEQEQIARLLAGTQTPIPSATAPVTPATVPSGAALQSIAPTVQSTQVGQTQPNKFWEWFKQYGVPLAAAGVGMASDSALPAATGFSTGYVGERQRQQLSKEEADKKAKEDSELQDVYEYDEETRDFKKIGQMPKGAKAVTRNRPSSGGFVPIPTQGSVAPNKAKTAAKAAKELISEDLVNQYMQQYPDKKREEIIAAIERQQQ